MEKRINLFGRGKNQGGNRPKSKTLELNTATFTAPAPSKETSHDSIDDGLNICLQIISPPIVNNDAPIRYGTPQSSSNPSSRIDKMQLKRLDPISNRSVMERKDISYLDKFENKRKLDAMTHNLKY